VPQAQHNPAQRQRLGVKKPMATPWAQNEQMSLRACPAIA